MAVAGVNSQGFEGQIPPLLSWLFMEPAESAVAYGCLDDSLFPDVQIRHTQLPCVSAGRTAYIWLLFRSNKHGDEFYPGKCSANQKNLST